MIPSVDKQFHLPSPDAAQFYQKPFNILPPTATLYAAQPQGLSTTFITFCNLEGLKLQDFANNFLTSY